MSYWDYNEILSRMLIAAQNAQPECDTREGSLIYTACAPMAAELAQAYIASTLLLDNTFADKATREYLIRRAAERGVTPYEASYAEYICDWSYTGSSAPNIGDRFYSSDGIVFTITSVQTGTKTAQLKCDQIGTIGNGKTGAFVPVQSDNRFISMSVKSNTVIGEDAESTEHLRARYFRELQSLSFGGSVNDYVNFVNNITGVGATKVYPTWNGGGTVKVVIADSALQPATPELVSTVQYQLAPSGNQGLGIAPIGHTVTVVAAEGTSLAVTAYFIYLPGYSFESLGSLLITKLKNYIDELNANWENNTQIIVRQTNVIAELLSVPGVLDIQNLKINGVSGNITLGENKLAVYGSLTEVGS